MRRRHWALLVAVSMAIWLGLASGPGAEPAHASTADTAAGSRHCVIDLAPVPAASTEASDVLGFRCFDSFRAAVAYVTNGLVRLPAGARQISGAELPAADGELLSSALLGVEYEDSGYDGSTLSLTGSGSGCYGGATYRFPRMSSYGFDNVISSAKVYNNCFSTHYAATYYDGSQRTCYSNCSGMGSMNDRTSSIEFW